MTAKNHQTKSKRRTTVKKNQNPLFKTGPSTLNQIFGQILNRKSLQNPLDAILALFDNIMSQFKGAHGIALIQSFLKEVIDELETLQKNAVVLLEMGLKVIGARR